MQVFNPVQVMTYFYFFTFQVSLIHSMCGHCGARMGSIVQSNTLPQISQARANPALSELRHRCTLSCQMKKSFMEVGYYAVQLSHKSYRSMSELPILCAIRRQAIGCRLYRGSLDIFWQQKRKKEILRKPKQT